MSCYSKCFDYSPKLIYRMLSYLDLSDLGRWNVALASSTSASTRGGRGDREEAVCQRAYVAFTSVATMVYFVNLASLRSRRAYLGRLEKISRQRLFFVHFVSLHVSCPNLVSTFLVRLESLSLPKQPHPSQAVALDILRNIAEHWCRVLDTFSKSTHFVSSRAFRDRFFEQVLREDRKSSERVALIAASINHRHPNSAQNVAEMAPFVAARFLRNSPLLGKEAIGLMLGCNDDPSVLLSYCYNDARRKQHVFDAVVSFLSHVKLPPVGLRDNPRSKLLAGFGRALFKTYENRRCDDDSSNKMQGHSKMWKNEAVVQRVVTYVANTLTSSHDKKRRKKRRLAGGGATPSVNPPSRTGIALALAGINDGANMTSAFLDSLHAKFAAFYRGQKRDTILSLLCSDGMERPFSFRCCLRRGREANDDALRTVYALPTCERPPRPTMDVAADRSLLSRRLDPSVPLFSKGDGVLYVDERRGRTKIPASVVGVHTDDVPAYYTIRFDKFREKQTVERRLRHVPDSVPWCQMVVERLLLEDGDRGRDRSVGSGVLGTGPRLLIEVLYKIVLRYEESGSVTRRPRRRRQSVEFLGALLGDTPTTTTTGDTDESTKESTSAKRSPLMSSFDSIIACLRMCSFLQMQVEYDLFAQIFITWAEKSWWLRASEDDQATTSKEARRARSPGRTSVSRRPKDAANSKSWRKALLQHRSADGNMIPTKLVNALRGEATGVMREASGHYAKALKEGGGGCAVS